MILGEGVGKRASLGAAQFGWARKSFLKFGEGSEGLSERFGGFRKLLLGFLQLLGDLGETPCRLPPALRDLARLLQQLAGTRKLWSKLPSAPLLQSLDQGRVPPAAAAATRHFAKAVLDASNRRPAISMQMWKSPGGPLSESRLSSLSGKSSAVRKRSLVRARASNSLATTRTDFHRQSAPAKAIAIENDNRGNRGNESLQPWRTHPADHEHSQRHEQSPDSIFKELLEREPPSRFSQLPQNDPIHSHQQESRVEEKSNV